MISHEAAHALARHAGERQSQAMLAQMGGLGLGLGLGGVGALAGQAIGRRVTAWGLKYGILLPYSRTQELEADKIGLILMAKAGYDPALALDFWRRMMTDEDVKLRPPQFMSTHPRDDSRMQAMVDFLPEAEKHYVPVVETAPAPSPPQEALPPAPPAAPQPVTPPAPRANSRPAGPRTRPRRRRPRPRRPRRPRKPPARPAPARPRS